MRKNILMKEITITYHGKKIYCTKLNAQSCDFLFSCRKRLFFPEWKKYLLKIFTIRIFNNHSYINNQVNSGMRYMCFF